MKMKKHFKRLIAAASGLVVLLSSVFAFQGNVFADEVTGTAKEVTINVAEGVTTSGYMFTPKFSVALGSRATVCPIMIVFGDEDYNEETAVSAAVDSGLAEIAKEEGSTILFLNWSGVSDAQAVDMYSNILDLYSDDTETEYVDGYWEGEKFDFATGGMIQGFAYAGTAQRIYLYGEGKGADYVVKNYLKEVIKATTFPDGFTMEFNNTPTSITLFNPSVAPESIDTEMEIPVAVVNAVDGTEVIISDLNKTHKAYAVENSDVTDGFDKELLVSLYEKLSGKYRRQVGVVHEIPDYAALGIDEVHKMYEGTEYFLFIPEELDLTKEEEIPLVMIFHGGGNHAEYQAWASEWPLIGKEEGFMVVSVNKHPDQTAADAVALLDALVEEYPSIDESRIYASGFSMGSVKSWALADEYTDRFAGIAPMNGSFEAAETVPELIMPVFYVAGQDSPLDEFPSQKGEANNLDLRLSSVFKMNKIADSYTYDNSANKWWGVAADETETINDTIYKDSVLTLNKFKSEDGNIYTVLCDVSGMSHEVYAAPNRAAWDFLSQFSRGEEGVVLINGEEPSSSSAMTIVIIVAVVVVAAAFVTVAMIRSKKKDKEKSK